MYMISKYKISPMKKKERKKNIEFTQLIVYQLGDDILCNIYIYI